MMRSRRKTWGGYEGDLAAPILLPQVGGFILNANEWIERREKKLLQERTRKVKTLFLHFGVQEGDWATLAIYLALAHVPGLLVADVNKRGRPTVWTYTLRMRLFQEVEMLCQGKKKLRPEKALYEMADQCFWKDALHKRNPFEAMRCKYYELMRGG